MAKIQKFALTILIYLIVQACYNPKKVGYTKYGENGKIIEGYTPNNCDKPPKTYTKALELKVKNSVDSLLSTPLSNIELGLKQSVTNLSQYTSEGLDVSLFLYYICKMANNRQLSSAETSDLITKALNVYNSNEEVKKKLNN